MDFSPFAQVVDGMDVVDRIFKIGEKPDQGRIQAEGNKYLKKEFPRLTCVPLATSCTLAAFNSACARSWIKGATVVDGGEL